MSFSALSLKEKHLFLSIAVLILLIYGQSLWGGFVFDDRGIAEHYDVLSSLGNLKDVALHPYWNTEAGLYRPITLLSYAFNIIFLGGSAASFHFINLLIYFGICVSIYLLIKKLFENEWLAYATSLLFLVLPIHTEVVANITGRSELMALFFSLLALLEFTKEKTVPWRVGLWLLLAVGAKETAVAAIPLILLIILMREKGIGLSSFKKYFIGLSAAFIAAVIYFTLRFFVLGPAHFLGIQTSPIENPLLFVEWPARVATALKILWMYVSKSFWPANLCSDYSYNQIPVIESFLHLEVILGLAVLIAAAVAIFFYMRRKPAISFAAAIFLFSFLPVSNLPFPIGTIAGERLFFFPSLGLVLAAAYILYKLKWRRPVLVAVLIVYGILAFNRQAVWMSEEKLFTNAGECAPQSVLSLSNAGTVYYFRGEYEKAAEILEASKAIKPIYSKGLNNLGLVYWKMGRNREAEALYHDALTQKHPYGGALENLVLLYLSEKDYESARRWLKVMYPNNDQRIEETLKEYQGR